LRRFEEEFVGLNNALLDMGGMVAQSVHRSVLALVERNADYAYQVMRDEVRHRRVRYPHRRDGGHSDCARATGGERYALVVAAIKISTDLERMGDLAVSIARAPSDADGPSGTASR
jgi:phosphate transport system protein